MTYAAAKAERDRLELAAKAASDAIRAFPVGPTGITPDHVKTTPEWQAARLAYSQAHGRLAGFNAVFTAQYRDEIRAERKVRS